MKQLERMASELFHSFARMEGREANWDYLSEERKKAWIRDVMVMARYFVVQLQKEVKPMPNRNAHTSFESGFVAGQKSERLAFQQLVEEIYNQLENEYDALQEN
jgi:hypothetical protein